MLAKLCSGCTCSASGCRLAVPCCESICCLHLEIVTCLLNFRPHHIRSKSYKTLVFSLPTFSFSLPQLPPCPTTTPLPAVATAAVADATLRTGCCHISGHRATNCCHCSVLSPFAPSFVLVLICLSFFIHFCASKCCSTLSSSPAATVKLLPPRDLEARHPGPRHSLH